MFMLAVCGFEDLHVHQDCGIIAFVTCVHTVGGNHFRAEIRLMVIIITLLGINVAHFAGCMQNLAG